MHAHRRLARAGAASAAPAPGATAAAAPAAAAIAAAAVARRAARHDVRVRAAADGKGGGGDGSSSSSKDGKAAAAAAPAAASATPPAPAASEKKAPGDREGLNYVAHPYGTGRLTSDDEEGAFLVSSRFVSPGGVPPAHRGNKSSHAPFRLQTPNPKQRQTWTSSRSRRSGTCSTSGER